MGQIGQIRYLTALGKVTNHYSFGVNSLILHQNQRLLLLGGVPTNTVLQLPNEGVVPAKKVFSLLPKQRKASLSYSFIVLESPPLLDLSFQVLGWALGVRHQIAIATSSASSDRFPRCLWQSSLAVCCWLQTLRMASESLDRNSFKFRPKGHLLSPGTMANRAQGLDMAEQMP